MNHTSFTTPPRNPFQHGMTIELVPRARILAAVIERQGRRLLTQRRSAANPFFATTHDIVVRWPDEAPTVRRTRRPGLQ
jgi:hypothetical protein